MERSTPLRAPGFRRLLAAQSISSIGDWLATFSMMALVLAISGSSAAVGGILVLRLSPAIVAGPLIGRIVTRWSSRAILLRADLARAAIAAALPLVSELWWVYGWALALEAVTVIAVAARDGSVIGLVDRGDLPLANGLLLGSTYGSLPAGAAAFAAISALVTGSGRFALAFGIDAATFVASYLLVSRIRELARAQPPAGTERLSLGRALAIPIVRSTIGPLTVASVGIGTLFSLGIVFVRDTLGAREGQFGVLVVVFGFGALLGLWLRQSGPLPRGVVGAVRAGVLTMGAVLMAMSLVPSVLAAFGAALVFGAAASYAIVSGITGLQTAVEADRRLLALSVFHVAVRLALGIGAMGAGVAADVIDTVTWPVVGVLDGVRVVMFGAGLIAVSGALSPRLGGRARRRSRR